MTFRNKPQLIRPYDHTLHFTSASLCPGPVLINVHPNLGAGEILGEARQSLQVYPAVGKPAILGNVYLGREGAVYAERPAGGCPKPRELHGASCASGL